MSIIKSIKDLDRKELNKVLSDAWLNLYVDEEKLYNPLLKIPKECEETPHLYFTWLMTQPEYFSFICSQILNVNIFPLQGLTLKNIWNHKFPMLIASRGFSKTYTLAVYSLLRMLLLPGRKLVVTGAAFRQSKLVFEYMENIWDNAPILRDICRGGNNQGPTHGTDVWSFRIGESILKALPIGMGDKIRGQRANDVLADEFSSIVREIFETVIAGFAVVSANPVDKLQIEAKKRLLELWGISDKDNYFLPTNKEETKDNQIILSGTAYYDFNHFADYWKKWHSIISSKGDKEKLSRIFNGEVPKGFNYRDFSIMRIPVDLLPPGYMDDAQISRSKATIHTGIFEMEFGACFTKDSAGFFKRSLIESCIASPSNKIMINNEQIVFTPLLYGDRTKKYIYSIDPASETDNFSIIVLELEDEYRKIVNCWVTDKKEHRERIASGLCKEDDFYGFCARKIRELMKRFPCVGIAIDSQGGGVAVMEALRDRKKLEEGEEPILPIIDISNPRDTDGEQGLHILHIINFVDNKWTVEANHGLRKDFEDKKCLFPYFDAIHLAIASIEKDDNNSLYDTMDDNIYNISELKNELSIITMSQTATGKDKWDTPEIKIPGHKKGKLKKDRYSALLMANSIARNLELQSHRPDYKTEASWAGESKTNGPSYIGPQNIINTLSSYY